MKVHGRGRAGGQGSGEKRRRMRGGGGLTSGEPSAALSFRGALGRVALVACGVAALGCSRSASDPEKEPEKPATHSPGSAPQGATEGTTVTKHAAHHGAAHDARVPGGLEPMQHAFFLVGREHPFLVHMTNMWMDAHLYQMVLRVTLPEATREVYEKDRAQHPDDWYIVGNVAADKMAIADLARGAKSTFRGSLWRSWPTAEGEDPHWPWSATPPVAEDFEVRVERVVQYRHFDWNLRRPRWLTYFLFGEGKEAHMQSYQIRQPDFDHVVSLSSPPTWLPPALLEAGVHVNFVDVPATPRKADPAVSPRADVYCKAPVDEGTHQVELGGQEKKQPLEIERTVFFGTYPVNEVDPCTPSQVAEAAQTPKAKKGPRVWRSGRK